MYGIVSIAPPQNSTVQECRASEITFFRCPSMRNKEFASEVLDYVSAEAYNLGIRSSVQQGPPICRDLSGIVGPGRPSFLGKYGQTKRVSEAE